MSILRKAACSSQPPSRTAADLNVKPFHTSDMQQLRHEMVHTESGCQPSEEPVKSQEAGKGQPHGISSREHKHGGIFVVAHQATPSEDSPADSAKTDQPVVPLLGGQEAALMTDWRPLPEEAHNNHPQLANCSGGSLLDAAQPSAAKQAFSVQLLVANSEAEQRPVRLAIAYGSE